LLDSIKKRKALLTCVRNGFNLERANKELTSRSLTPVGDLEWALWETYYEPIARTNKVFEHEIIENGRSLSWLARQINERKKRTTIS